jgi:signal transduction histidine kinase
MVLKIALVISILLHFFAASVAIRLTKVTKYNLSWMLITMALMLMAIRLSFEFIPFISDLTFENLNIFFVWLGVGSSIFLAAGVFLIRRIFNYMREVEAKTREYENKLLTTAIETEEHERRRFAKDLHDGLGPILSTIKLSLSALDSAQSPTQKQKILNNVKLMVNEGVRSIKEISDNLSPHVLQNFGLEVALQNFINKACFNGSLEIDFDNNFEALRLNENTEIVLYRVACELINNTLKHAEASRAELKLFKNDRQVNMVYSDNGKGFDIDMIESYTGMGLNNILSRVNSLKGTVSFERQEPHGVVVNVIIPVK